MEGGYGFLCLGVVFNSSLSRHLSKSRNEGHGSSVLHDEFLRDLSIFITDDLNDRNRFLPALISMKKGETNKTQLSSTKTGSLCTRVN